MWNGNHAEQHVSTMDLVHVPRSLPPAPPHDRAIAEDVAAYLLYKRKRLTGKSERGYKAYLHKLVDQFPDHTLEMFEPPFGSMLLEDFLNRHWGHRAPATYNKARSVLCDFFAWHVKRMNLMRDPMLVIERATARAIRRVRFSEDEWLRIFAANPDPHDQIALHLLLDYALRKGALQNVQFEHFDFDSRELTIFTKGEKIFRIDIPDAHIWWYGCLARAGVVSKGVTSGRRMHSARYTAAQRLLEATSDIKAVQTLLCHANSATTDLYVQGDSKKVGARMAGYVGRGETELSAELQGRVRDGSRL